MQRKHQLIVYSVIALGLGYWNIRQNQASAGSNLQEQSLSSTAAGNTQGSPAPINSQSSGASTKAAATPSKTDLASLEDMSRTLFQFTRPDSRLADLVQYLDSSRQQPLVTHNSNPDSGDMVIVRTKSPLPGTRYFHAQYFSDENNNSFVQHMSFEFKPGPTAMNDAVSAVEKAFPDLPSPKIQNGNFVQWDVPGGYVLWIKKMQSNDLQDDPFNAYTDEDVGTVRVAMELEIHGDEDHH